MDYTTIQTHADGRMLCPRCGAPLYARAVEVLSGMPVFLAKDDHGIRIEFNGDDATHSHCETAMQYCACGWSSDDIEPAPPVEDSLLQGFIEAVTAKVAELLTRQSDTGQRIYDPVTAIGFAVAETLEPLGFNVEPTQWCAITHPDVRGDEEARLFPTQEILELPGMQALLLAHIGEGNGMPVRFVPLPYGVLGIAPLPRQSP